jgi:aminoglycoside phosphotransferase (APT) family kinase protein
LADDLYLAALTRMGLVRNGDAPMMSPLTGGVSSDIVRVDLDSGPICLKRALPRLRVEAEWHAPIERNRFEVAWMRVAARLAPDAVPRVIGEDRESGLFAMQYLDPAAHPVWKTQLRDGTIAPGTADAIGRCLAAIHNGTAGDVSVAETFETGHIFFPIRLEPYLLATAARHPDCAARLEDLVRITAVTRRVLVHGDVSPKNILVGPRGPVFLDAECAWYGDPSFDLAFCLNHLLLKCVWRPAWRDRYLTCFDTLAESYLSRVGWEPRQDVENRASRLLPGLLLGRVDGRSPVEYITLDADRDRVRRVARALLRRPADDLSAVRAAWMEGSGP